MVVAVRVGERRRLHMDPDGGRGDRNPICTPCTDTVLLIQWLRKAEASTRYCWCDAAFWTQRRTRPQPQMKRSKLSIGPNRGRRWSWRQRTARWRSGLVGLEHASRTLMDHVFALAKKDESKIEVTNSSIQGIRWHMCSVQLHGGSSEMVSCVTRMFLYHGRCR